MKQEFKIDLKNQYKSMRHCLILFVITSFGTIVVAGIVEKNFNLNSALLIFLFSALFFLGMVLPFHIQYLYQNWNTKLIIDSNSQIIQIKERSQNFECNLSEIIVERVICHQSSYKTPFKNYGFLRIITKQNQNFVITSLMIEPLKIPLKINETKYRIPFIKTELSKAELAELILDQNQIKTNKIAIFTKSFEDYSSEKLTFMLENRKTLQSEAIIAIEKILKIKK